MTTSRLTNKPFELLEVQGEINTDYQTKLDSYLSKTIVLIVSGLLLVFVYLLLPKTTINTVIITTAMIILFSLSIFFLIYGLIKADKTVLEHNKKVEQEIADVYEENCQRLITWVKDEANIEVGIESAELLLAGELVMSLEGLDLWLTKAVDDKRYLFQGEFDIED